jgi:hypothetical protein
MKVNEFLIWQKMRLKWASNILQPILLKNRPLTRSCGDHLWCRHWVRHHPAVMVLVVVVFFIHFVISKEGLESLQESLGFRALPEFYAT